MRNTLLVGYREFKQRLRSRGFLLGALGMPVLMIAFWLFSGAAIGEPTAVETQAPVPAEEEIPQQVIGYVDQSGLIVRIPEVVPANLFRPYADVEAANQAMQQGRIAAYYIVPEDYVESGQITRVSPQLPTLPDDPQIFNWILAANLVPDASNAELIRLRNPFNQPSPNFVSLEEGDSQVAQGSMLPFLVSIMVMLPLFISGGYLLQSLAQEKGSRILEILLVSLQPRQLLTGKLLGLGALIFIQYLFWILVLAGVMLVTGQDLTGFFAGLDITSVEVIWMFGFALGGFVLYAGMMAGIGALAPNMENGRSWTIIITLPMMIPIYLWAAIASDPNGILATVLSIFPFSAPVAMLMRMTSAYVPLWQTLTSMGLLVLTAIGIILLMARLFRARTLLSGESISLKRFWSAVTA